MSPEARPRPGAGRRLALFLLLLLPWPALAEPLPTVEVAPGVFVHAGPHEDFTPANAGGIANLAFVVGGAAVAVIDTGGSHRQGLQLREAIEARTDLPVRYVVNTHVHPDHLLGNTAFPEATLVGHARLAERLAEAGPFYLANLERLLGEAFEGTEIVPPTLAVASQMTLDLGGRTLELTAWPTAHTNTDLTVLDPATGTLLAGDLVFMERLPVVDGSLLGWLEVLERLQAVPAERVVPGHGPPSAPWPAAAAPQQAYLEFLRDGVRAALAGNRPLDEAVGAVPLPPGHGWLLTGENHPRNVTASYTELEWE